MVYSPPLPDVDSNKACAFCEKNDIVHDMIIATLDGDGERVYPVEEDNYVLLCNWCAHFESKEERDIYTYWKLNELIYNSLIGEGEISDYNGIL